MAFLKENAEFARHWDYASLGWLIGIPVLSGAVMRLPMGILTDKYGGRWVYGLLLLGAAVPMAFVSFCSSFWEFFIASLGFGMCGTSFAIGIAYTSVWFPKHRQGLALGIFGAGNAGAAVTALCAPSVLRWLISDATVESLRSVPLVSSLIAGENVNAWRILPLIYAASLTIMGVVFLLFTKNRLPEGSGQKTLPQRLEPLKQMRVWRFGLYYFYVFGGFVALSQWLIPYYVDVYAMSIAMAGFLAATFSLPSGVIRALGGWLSDALGARTVTYWIFGLSLVCFVLLIFPQMTIESPGSGVMARTSGEIVQVSNDQIVVRTKLNALDPYPYSGRTTKQLATREEKRSGFIIFPRSMSWQTPTVEVGQQIMKRELLAQGTSQIFFQANVWIFTGLVFIIGILTGFGKAGVYRYIPDYFPGDVGVGGGIVGVLGGLGGFVCPIIFGYLLNWTGLWTTCWMFFLVLTGVCMIWLHLVVRGVLKKEAPEQLHRIEAVIHENIFEEAEATNRFESGVKIDEPAAMARST